LEKEREEQQPGTEIVLFWSQFLFFCARFQSVGRGICTFFGFVSLFPLSIDIRTSLLLFRDIEMSRTRMAERNPESRGETFFFFLVCVCWQTWRAAQTRIFLGNRMKGGNK
jgi:hypothetical protein